ncbi:MAG TPA: glycosyl hydrolase [Solirubrobacterales bacterium]|nr:glycosyl hydrolase [Solirubrobacterales bacterium]
MEAETREEATDLSASPSSIYWGAWIGAQLTGEESPWDMNAVSKFEQMAGKKLSIVQFGSPFSNCYSRSCYFYEFPTGPLQQIREHGSIPFLSWSSQSIPTSTQEPNYQLADVVDGTYDSYIRKFAKAAAAWGHPFFLRFDHEMNGDWFPWAAGANGNTAADYVAAWRHVHDIFTEVGATNATWVWCPNVDPDHTMQSLSSLYPGNEYVDWTCLDGYNWGTNPSAPWGWGSFAKIFRSTYDEVTEQIAPEKPMIVGETAATEYGGSKAEWISEMLSKVPTAFPKIRGLLWFEKYDDGMDWPIETSPSSVAAFAEGIQNPAYATNSFADLETDGPIPPPAA